MFLRHWTGSGALHRSPVRSAFSGLLGKILIAIRDAGFEISAMQMVRSLTQVTTH